ncbi:hypothetical protein QLX08_000114 [Tetragonisca angustula]|uniref:Uncharacterized protein n=1 Tax=Tetragonisca angustula TaxID=166442 RepID=A0AAW1AL01_9HYME
MTQEDSHPFFSAKQAEWSSYLCRLFSVSPRYFMVSWIRMHLPSTTSHVCGGFLDRGRAKQLRLFALPPPVPVDLMDPGCN